MVAGAVRDQLGRPISGAFVTAGTARARTAADGTFVIETNAAAVTISCAYCERTTVRPGDDGTVAAIVRVYTALQQDVPSAEDIAAVPFSHAQQLLSLVPFAVLDDSTQILPGPRVSLYGGRSGGLLVDNGIASYDSAAGASPYRTIPGFDVASFDVRGVADAPRYGDLAGGGTFLVDETGTSATGVFAGGERAARGSFASQGLDASAASYGDAYENTQRADARMSAAGSQYTFSGVAYSANDTFDGLASQSLRSFSSAAGATILGPGPEHPYVSFSADRAGYTLLPLAGTGLWSDVTFDAGVRGGTAVELFADAGTRFSTSMYSYGRYGVLRDTGTAQQTRVDAGAAAQTGAVRWQALAGLLDVATATNGLNVAAAQHATAFTPSIDADVQIAPQWSLDATAAEAIDVPPLLERYYYGVSAQNALERISLLRAALQFSDLHRLKLGVAATREGYSDAAPQNGLGLLASWQISPQISLRAWTYRFGDVQNMESPASAWLALRSPGGVSADLIWQRDLLDGKADPHLNASFAVPVWSSTKLFAATESRAGRRFTTIGLRFAQ